MIIQYLKRREEIIFKKNELKSIKNELKKTSNFHKSYSIKRSVILNFIFFRFINILILKYLLLLLPIKVVVSSEYQIELKLEEDGEQQIFSDEYNISEYYPEKIMVNNETKILNNTKILLESKNFSIYIKWNNSNLDLSYMFANLENIISASINCDNYNCTNTSYMFYNCIKLKNLTYTHINYNNLSIEQNLDATKMFYNCSSLNTVKFIFNSTDKIYINMSYMLYNCYNLSNFSFGDNFIINDMRYMFYNCEKLNDTNLNNIEIGTLVNMSYSFYNCKNLKNIKWKDQLSIPSDMRNMFYNCITIKSISLPLHLTDENLNMSKMFYNCFNLSRIEFNANSSYYPNDMHEMFYNCSSLGSLDFQNFIHFDYVKDISLLFYNCSNLSMINFNFFNSLTTNMNGIFQNCNSLKSLNLTNFYTSNVEIMTNMFSGCSELNILNLDNFNTSKVIEMESMFEECSNLTSLSLDNFETSQVQNMNKMFSNCINLRYLNFKNISITSVTTMNEMFYNCKNLQYLNIYHIQENKIQSINDIFTDSSNNFTFCINENEDIPNIFKILLNMTNTIRDCSDNCYEQVRGSIPEKKLCCSKFIYNNTCYEKCPSKTHTINNGTVCEFLNCSDSEFYNYEQNSCINNISGYYVNDTEGKTIDKCHEDCLECKGQYTNSSTNCTKCKNEKPYIYLGNCYDNCTPGF